MARPSDEELAKRCAKCEESKALSSFYNDKRAADGKRSACKTCVNAKRDAWNAANPERVAEWKRRYVERAWEKTLASKAKYRRTHRAQETARLRAYGREHPEKRAAHAAVAAAIDNGTMKAPERCSSCGRRMRLLAHHEDYSKRLDVMWLCPKCHDARHVELERKVAS